MMNVRLFTIQNYILLKRRILYVLGERGLFTIQNYILLKLYCQPYIIEECLFTIQNYILLKLAHRDSVDIWRLFTIQNYILLKLLFCEVVQRKCLFTIQNYTPLYSSAASDVYKRQPLKRTIQIIFNYICLTTIKNYTPLKLLSMRYPCVVVLQPYKTTQLSNPNIICKKESPKEKVKEKKSQIIDSFSL